MPVLRLGIVGCDTSHVVEFSKRLLHRDIAQEQWVDGATVVAAWPGASAIAADRLPGFVAQLRAYGVRVVDRPEEFLTGGGGCDAVLVEAQEGGLHRGLAIPFLEAGMPVFIDKPFACSMADAAAMVETAARRGVPLLSASSLRFAREVTGLRIGPVLGAHAFAPAALHPRNPGLFHYYAKRLHLRFHAETQAFEAGPVRGQIMARVVEPELARDPERKGFGVLIRVRTGSEPFTGRVLTRSA